MIFLSKKTQEKGFTIVELSVVMAIIFIISGIAAANYRHGDRAVILNNQAFQFTQDVRRAQELALSSREFNSVAAAGYGILIVSGNDYYIIYADLDGNKKYSGEAEIAEKIFLNNKIEILNIEMRDPEGGAWQSANNGADINYAAPDLTGIMTELPDQVRDLAKITFRVIGDSRTRAAVANIAGLVYVE